MCAPRWRWRESTFAAPGFHQVVDYLMKLIASTSPAYCKEAAMISDKEAAYTAGIIDGEGSISLTKNRKSRWPSPQVSVSSNDCELLDWLKLRFGGSIVTKKPAKPTHSISFNWKLTDRRALLLLKVVFPYLVIVRKRLRAELLLTAYLDCTPRNGRYDEEKIQKKQALISSFTSLP
jgi:hypothetical protein